MDRGSGRWADAPVESWFSAEFGRLAALAALLGAEDPENLAQEAVTRFASHRQRLRSDEAARSYLRTILVNLVRNESSRHGVRRRYLRALGRSRPTYEMSAEDEAIQRIGPSTVGAAVYALPSRQREAIVLRYWLDLSVAQIAEVMSVPEGTAASHLSRGAKALRLALGQPKEDDSDPV